MTVDGERKFTGILHDLTDRVQMEAQLREQAALAKLGEMAAVVAHEVKNPAGRHPRRRFRSSPAGWRRQRRQPRSCRRSSSRIDALDQMMKDLLLFARPPQPRRAPTDLVPLVTTTANLLSQDPAVQRRRYRRRRDRRRRCRPTRRCSEIVFQNLLINGAHAMHGKGQIRVAVEAGDSMCQIAFSDAGPGIPTELREKIFTPFFTTKSRGSGLGLPTAKRLIEAHNGAARHRLPAGRRHDRRRTPAHGPGLTAQTRTSKMPLNRGSFRMPATGRRHDRLPASRARR